MTKVDIFSCFLGAGKTTLIKKLIAEAYKGERLVLIENEFGEIGIDGGFMQDAGIEVTEMNSGCICCSLVGDFGKALRKVVDEYAPDRILIEPSGVGKLSDVIRAVQNVGSDALQLNSFTAVVDANKCKMYMKNFGEFFNDQVEHANAIILSRTGEISPDKLNTDIALLREHNPNASLIVTPWSELTGAQILEAMEKRNTLEAGRRAGMSITTTTMTTMSTSAADITITTMTTMSAAAATTITTMTMSTSAADITITTMTMSTSAAATTTAMTKMNTSITTTAGSATIPNASAITTITMPMRCLPAGEWRHPRPLPWTNSRQTLRRWTMRRSTAPCCAPRA